MHMSDSDVSAFHIPGTSTAYYIPNFVTVEEEEYLIRKIHDTPRQKWKQLANRRLQVWGGEITSKNALIPQSMPSFVLTYPRILERFRDWGFFRHAPHGQPNHIILNEYLPGQGIMPHEDGPAYHPVVATISLGSHAMFHYYKYQAQPQQSASDAPESRGQTIDSVPVHSIFLEPRSLIVTTGSLYTSHLHGIREIDIDAFTHENTVGTPLLSDLKTPVDNWQMVDHEHVRDVLFAGGVLERGTRYSLTCRDVGRVASGLRGSSR